MDERRLARKGRRPHLEPHFGMVIVGLPYSHAGQMNSRRDCRASALRGDDDCRRARAAPANQAGARRRAAPGRAYRQGRRQNGGLGFGELQWRNFAEKVSKRVPAGARPASVSQAGWFPWVRRLARFGVVIVVAAIANSDVLPHASSTALGGVSAEWLTHCACGRVLEG